ncbi:MAG TPA: hypothetical protein VGO07_07315, partial [Candidatus Saccharimonadales bacterium]|nr:hypothetical protein [Candidatus Saccharimonadales bacterium]
ESFLTTGRTFAAGRAAVIAPGVGRTPQERVVDTQDRIRRTLPRTLGSVYGRGTSAWARTGFAEHLGVAIEYGDPLVLDPAERGERSPYAAEQRALLAALVRPGGPELTRLFTLAMTSNDTNSGEWANFRSALDAVWNTRDTFDAVNARVTAVQSHLQKTHPDAVAVEHEQWAAEAALDMLLHNPTQILGRQVRAHPVGALAAAGGRHHAR